MAEANVGCGPCGEDAEKSARADADEVRGAVEDDAVGNVETLLAVLFCVHSDFFRAGANRRSSRFGDDCITCVVCLSI
tara:strand:- start:686 stop:919 length:234 start_codon:yes stop_codon:yes gene_type:complete